MAKRSAEDGVEVAFVIEEPYAQGALPGLHNQFNRSGVQPFLSLFDELLNNVIVKSSVVFLAELKLNLEPSPLRQSHNVFRTKTEFGETLSTFDPRNADIRAQIQIRLEPALSDGDFEGPSAEYGGNPDAFAAATFLRVAFSFAIIQHAMEIFRIDMRCAL